MSKKELVDKSINKLINEMGAELEIEKEIKKTVWHKNDIEKEKTNAEDLDNFIDQMHFNLLKERNEVLNLMDLVHFWESIYLSLKMQTNKEINIKSKIDVECINKALIFAEKVCGDTLENIYKKQFSVSGDIIELGEITQPKTTIANKELH